MNQAVPADATRKNDGTWIIAFGAVVASLGAYAFQVVAGRSLGAGGFAPVAAIWTIGFLVHTIVMLPVEQMTTRTVTLTAGDALRPATRRQIAIALILGGLAGIAIAALSVTRFFEDNYSFVAVMALLLTSRGLITIARGVMAGRRRFAAYGLSMMLEAAALVTLGVLCATLEVGAVWFGVTIAIAPLTVFLLRPYLVRKDPSRIAEPVPETNGLLQLLVVAAALSQLILAGGPLVAGLIGGTAAEVSIYFITFTLLRGPITASYGLATRFLAAMTTALSEDRPEDLHKWATRLGGVGVAGVVAAGVGGYYMLPAIVELLYGSEFRPSALVGGLGSAGAMAALVILYVTQILIARGRTRDLALAWLLASVIAGVVLGMSNAEPLLRVAYAFGAGEISAFASITVLALQKT